MKKFLDNWFHRFPLTYCFVIGMGGAAVIIASIDGLAYFIGGIKLMNATGVLSVGLAVFWLLKHYFKLRVLEYAKELQDPTKF